MKRAALSIALAAVALCLPAVVIWLVGGFAAWNLNVATWTFEGRGAAVLFYLPAAAFTSVCAWCAVADIYRD